MNPIEPTSADTRITGLALGKPASLTGYGAEISHKRGWAVGGLAGRDSLGVQESQISVGGQISLVARGETSPPVPTVDGGCERQNRRVEVVLP